MKDSVNTYFDYKKYLQAVIENSPAHGRGLRKAFSEAASCQTSYITHVLNGNAHFSLEQAWAISHFLGHTKDEARYFIAMVEYSKAATEGLKNHFLAQLNEISNRMSNLKDRIGVKESLSAEDQGRYYSAWYYSAIHVLITIPQYQTKEAVQRYFGLSAKKVTEVLEFLISCGLVIYKNGSYLPGKSKIHLGLDSPHLVTHHSNWRNRVIRSLDQENEHALHFSAVASISRKDLHTIKSILTKSTQDCVEVIKTSAEEKLYAISMDFFEV